jgi:hypothetical protein
LVFSSSRSARRGSKGQLLHLLDQTARTSSTKRWRASHQVGFGRRMLIPVQPRLSSRSREGRHANLRRPCGACQYLRSTRAGRSIRRWRPFCRIWLKSIWRRLRNFTATSRSTLVSGCAVRKIAPLAFSSTITYLLYTPWNFY